MEAQQSSSSGARSRDSSRGGSRDSSRDRLSNSGTLERKSSQPPNPLRPLPESLTFDMRYKYTQLHIKLIIISSDTSACIEAQAKIVLWPQYRAKVYIMSYHSPNSHMYWLNNCYIYHSMKVFVFEKVEDSSC